MLCWEDVTIDSFTNNTLLSWLHQQEDPLISDQFSGTHEQLKVQGRNVDFVPPCTMFYMSLINMQHQEHATSRTYAFKHGRARLELTVWPQLPTGMENQTAANTFRELVDEAWQSSADTIRIPSMVAVAFQMTM